MNTKDKYIKKQALQYKDLALFMNVDNLTSEHT